MSILYNFHLPNRTQKGTSIMQLRAVTNQYYIITLIKNLNPTNKSIIWQKIFHTYSRFHGILYFMHLICTLSLMYTSCILRSHPSFYNISFTHQRKKKKKGKKENKKYSIFKVNNPTFIKL